ncbi:hypothetical protein RIF29_21971 [Crotalaria pallida]|uniref:Uncharacterized protein n=1 Tax=Crotalaria pallida TaxID=3830 RepID=A0AAN9F7W6_CROPI
MFDDSSITNQAVDNVSVAIESGDHLPIKVEDTVPAAASETCIQLPVKPVDTLSPPSETSKRLPVKAVNTVSATCEIDRKPTRDFASGEIHGTPLACPPLQTKLPQPVESLHHQRRKPCFGWISDDDDDDDDEEEKPIELPPAPLFLK